MSRNGMAGTPNTRPVNLKNLPDPKTQYTVSFPRLDGGLNLYELSYRLNANESPDMQNLHWRNGALGCRDGQAWLIEPSEESEVGYTAFRDLFWGHIFVHVEDEIRVMDPNATEPVYAVLKDEIPIGRGTFFRYGEYLMYKNRGGYYRIAYNPSGQTPQTMFPVTSVTDNAFIPVTYINTNPTISFEPLAYYDGENIADPETNAATYATAEVRNLFEKFKMDYKIRDALTEGGVTGDYCGHFFWNPRAVPYGGAYGPYRGEIEMELVDGIDIMFGNPNTRDAQSQPYIIVLGRDTVDHLKAEAEYYRKKYPNDKHTEATMVTDANIIPDADTMDMAAVGGRIEIEPDDKTGKALYAYFYTKTCHEETMKDPVTGEDVMEPKTDEEGNRIQQKDKKGRPLFDMDGNPVWEMQKVKHMVTTVYVTKATKTCIIYEDIDTGLSLYPIAWGNWEKQKNQYHGRALVTGVVPNQIFLNTMFATIMRHMQLLGFPKTVFNADLIREWSNEVGEQIAVHGLLPNQSIQTVAYNLQPADMSNQIITTIDKTMQYTKECLGATDAQMGNVKPDNTSALMVLQSTSEVPLENIRANKNEWVEDIGRILLDMMGTYYHERPIVVERDFEEPVLDPAGRPVIDEMTGMMKMQTIKRKTLVPFDFSQFKHLWFNLSVDAGATTYYSEIAMVQTLDNLRKDGTLDVIDYLERLPDKLLPRRQELIDKMRQMMGVPNEEAQVMQPGAGAPAGAGNPLAASNVPVPAKPQAGKGGPNSKALPTMGGALETGRAMSLMPEGVQEDFSALPPTAQNSLKRLAGMKPQ